MSTPGATIKYLRAIMAFILLQVLPFTSLAQDQPRSFAYVLQAENLKPARAEAVSTLAQCGRDWIILDVSFNEDPHGRWAREELQAIRAAKPGRKILAYLSIGEAENYRPYWKKEWDRDRNGKPDEGAPYFLSAENPDWKGNYKVRYWQTGWQTLILAELDRILAAGFDGVYLDIIDAFEYFEYDPVHKKWKDNRINPETGQSYRKDMQSWVGQITTATRRQHPGFLVIPQNGSQLLADPDYAALVDGIGIEDLFTNGNKLRSPSDSAPILASLENLHRLQKPILTIAYGTSPSARKLSLEGAQKNGCVLLLTDRALKTLGESPGSKP